MKSIIFILFFIMNNSYSWDLVSESDGVRIYSKSAEKGVLPFKAVGIIKGNINVAYNALVDYKRKNEWAPKLKEVRVHEKLDDQEYLFSEFYKTPWPTSDREFLLAGRVFKKNHSYYFTAKSIKEEKLADEDHVQVYVEKLEVVLTKVNDNETAISFEFRGDFNGWLPGWLKTIIQKNWPKSFIKSFNKRVILLAQNQ